MGNKHSKDVYIGKDASKGAGEDDDKNTDKDTKKDSAKGNNKNPGKDSPFRYKEPTYKERRRNRLPNWFCISDTIGQPYRLDLLRFYFDRSDPQSLVKQLQKHWMAGRKFYIPFKPPLDRTTAIAPLTCYFLNENYSHRLEMSKRSPTSEA